MDGMLLFFNGRKRSVKFVLNRFDFTGLGLHQA